MSKYNTRLIKEKAVKEGYTNKQIAKIIGVHEVTISKWINGNIGNIEKFIDLCKLLDIEIEFENKKK